MNDGYEKNGASTKNIRLFYNMQEITNTHKWTSQGKRGVGVCIATYRITIANQNYTLLELTCRPHLHLQYPRVICPLFFKSQMSLCRMIRYHLLCVCILLSQFSHIFLRNFEMLSDVFKSEVLRYLRYNDSI